MGQFFVTLERVAPILQSKKLTSYRDLCRLVYYYKSYGWKNEDIAKELSGFEWGFSLKAKSKKEIMGTVLEEWEKIRTDGSFSEVCLYEDEVEYLQGIGNPITRKILYVALLYAKWSNHPSGWIRYKRDDFFDFWNIKISARERDTIMGECTSMHGMELRVIGSATPMVCYQLSFREHMGNVVRNIFDPDEIALAYYSVIGE